MCLMGREEYCEGEGKHFCKEFTSTCHLVLRTLDGTLACISTGCTTDYSTNRCVTRVITACHRAKCGTCQGSETTTCERTATAGFITLTVRAEHGLAIIAPTLTGLVWLR